VAREKEDFRAPAPRDQEYGNPLMTLRSQMDRLFDDFLGGSLMRPGNFWRTRLDGDYGFSMASPKIDVVEKDDQLVITAELPGIEEDEVEVTLDQGVLTIRGEKKSEEKREEGRAVISERRYGSFERRLALPEGIDEDKCRASFDKGVLTINLERQADAVRQPRRIPIGK